MLVVEILFGQCRNHEFVIHSHTRENVHDEHSCLYNEILLFFWRKNFLQFIFWIVMQLWNIEYSIDIYDDEIKFFSVTINRIILCFFLHFKYSLDQWHCIKTGKFFCVDVRNLFIQYNKQSTEELIELFFFFGSIACCVVVVVVVVVI